MGYKKKKEVEENQYQMEGSFEMKINKNQWKNAIVQVSNEQILVTLVDQENTAKYWQYSIARIQCQGRTWKVVNGLYG